MLSGYLGAADQAALVGETVSRIKRANPRALYCLDPVFGDDGRAYAKAGVAEAMARVLLPLADIVTPNAFELSSLTSIAVRGVDDALEGARRLGRPCVLATSVPDAARSVCCSMKRARPGLRPPNILPMPRMVRAIFWRRCLWAMFWRGGGASGAGPCGGRSIRRDCTKCDRNSPELALVAAQGALAGDDWQSTVALRKIG